MAKSVAESELYYEQVKAYFWRKDEADFVVGFSDSEMSTWKFIPTPSLDEMGLARGRLMNAGLDFAGFIHHEPIPFRRL